VQDGANSLENNATDQLGSADRRRFCNRVSMVSMRWSLAVEVDLVAAEPHQPVGLERLAERLGADAQPVRQFDPAYHVAGQDLAFQESQQASRIGV
jgi:hypothetical protein